MTAKIQDIFKLFTPSVDTIGERASVDEVMAKMFRDRGSRVVFVTDSEERLVGIIRMQDILRLLGARYMRNRGFSYARDVFAVTARDLMIEPVWVTPEDDAEDALRLAVQHALEDVPVVEGGRVVGEVDGFELFEGLRPSSQRRPGSTSA